MVDGDFLGEQGVRARSRVVLQPAGGDEALRHYRDTVAQPVPFDPHRDVLGSHYDALIERFPAGGAAMWGVVVSPQNRSNSFYEGLSVGDLVLFAGSGRFFAAGTVAYKWHSPPLAQRLWGVNDAGLTWAHMYALDEVRGIDLPYRAFNRVVGYAENAVPQELRLLDQGKSDRVFAGLFQPSVVRGPEVTLGQFEEATRDFDELDRQVTAHARLEQALLRRRLFGHRPAGICALCGQELPTDLLVAAHVKRRSACDHVERLDFENNVMAACTFGCDDLSRRTASLASAGGWASCAGDGAPHSPRVAARILPGTARTPSARSHLHRAKSGPTTVRWFSRAGMENPRASTLVSCTPLPLPRIEAGHQSAAVRIETDARGGAGKQKGRAI